MWAVYQTSAETRDIYMFTCCLEKHRFFFFKSLMFLLKGGNARFLPPLKQYRFRPIPTSLLMLSITNLGSISRGSCRSGEVAREPRARARQVRNRPATSRRIEYPRVAAEVTIGERERHPRIRDPLDTRWRVSHVPPRRARDQDGNDRVLSRLLRR